VDFKSKTRQNHFKEHFKMESERNIPSRVVPGWNGVKRQCKRDNFADITITVGQKTFTCHRVVLASLSPYFEVMFTSGMRESQSGHVTLHDIESELFEEVLDFIYTGKDIVTLENVDEVLRVSSMLQINCLKERCEVVISENLEIENCLYFWKFVSLHGCDHVSKKAMHFILNSFVHVWQKGDFLKLDYEDILAIIRDNDLNTPDEETVFESVVRWINHDNGARDKYAPALFEQIRFPLMQPEYLVKRVDPLPVCQTNTQCKEFVEEAKRYHLLQARRQEFVSTRLARRNHGDHVEVIIFIGGKTHPKTTSTDLWCYCLANRLWTRLRRTPYDIGVEFSSCSHGNAVFISGGSERSNKMIYFVTTQCAWYRGKNMLIGRKYHCMVSYGNSIYVLGGYEDDEYESRCSTHLSVERYDVTTTAWEECGYLAIPVRSAAAAVIQGKIFVYGGISVEDVCLDTVQCFDPRSRDCTVLNITLPLSGTLSCVSCNQTTYLIFPNVKVAKMTNATEIEESGDIENFSRAGFGVLQHNGNILLIGGVDSTKILDDFVEFNPEKNDCKMLDHQMIRPMFGFGCAKAVLAKSYLPKNEQGTSGQKDENFCCLL